METPQQRADGDGAFASLAEIRNMADIEAVLAGEDLLLFVLAITNPNCTRAIDAIRDRNVELRNPGAVRKALSTAAELRGALRPVFKAELRLARKWIEHSVTRLAPLLPAAEYRRVLHGDQDRADFRTTGGR